jgi:hypothetical protein
MFGTEARDAEEEGEGGQCCKPVVHQRKLAERHFIEIGFPLKTASKTFEFPKNVEKQENLDGSRATGDLCYDSQSIFAERCSENIGGFFLLKLCTANISS